MSYNWINPEQYTMDTFLYFDRWIIRYIMKENVWYNSDTQVYKTDMAIALKFYPYVLSFCKHKAPECKKFLDEVSEINTENISKEEARNAEINIIRAIETFVVYAYPEIMEDVNYIKNWNAQRLYDLVDLQGKVVLDIGSGTGRLAFAAAKYAKVVYASEPCDMLREYMRDRIKANSITNIKVLDGEVLSLPYEADTFDVVLSGHVVGDFYDDEIAEMERITKNKGKIVICNGDDEFKRESPNGNVKKTL